MLKKITNKKFIQSKSKENQVIGYDNGIYKVISGTSGSEYTVVMREFGAPAIANGENIADTLLPNRDAPT